MKIYEKTKYGYDLTEEAKEKSVTIQAKKKITYEDLEDILISFVESGVSNFWGGLDNTTPEWDNQPEDMPSSQYALQLLLEEKSLKIYDPEEEEDDSTWILTLDKLLSGIKLNYEKRPWDDNIKEGDATTADCIMQYALFGDLIFD